jgi:hypothetical protein
MKLSRMLAAAVGLTVAVSMSLPTVASAQPVREDVVLEDTEVIEDFCDVAGLTVEANFTVDLRSMFNQHGPDGLVHFVEHLTGTNVYTNVANGNAVTEAAMFVSKDLRVTDNGDGTLTRLLLQAGNTVVYGPEGEVIARDPGQIRIEAVFDYRGTLTDPSDDEFLEFRVVKESTGRTDDFCEAVVPILTG